MKYFSRTVDTEEGRVTIDHVKIAVREALRQKLDWVAQHLQIDIEESLNYKIQMLMDEIDRQRELYLKISSKNEKLEKRNKKLEKAIELQAEYRHLVEEMLNSGAKPKPKDPETIVVQEKKNGDHEELKIARPIKTILEDESDKEFIYEVIRKLFPKVFVMDVPEMAQEVIAMLRKANKRYVKLLVLRYGREMTYEQIGKELGICGGYARTQLECAKTALKRALNVQKDA
jgi:DNA-directed RNA polymerase specialized sigma24 family protein